MDGSVWAWGINIYGWSNFTNSPVNLPGISDVAFASIGKDHILALKTDGSLWGRGDNYRQQLSISAGGSSTFVQIPGLPTDITHVSAGLEHSIAWTRTAPVNQAPVAAFTATPDSGDAPLDVQFNAGASSDYSGIVSYAWDFGDGQSGSGKTTNHEFTTPGSYTVTLTVTDAIGLTDSSTHNITAAQTGTPPGTVTLIARDQFGQDVSGAQIYIRELGTWHPTGSQVQLTVGNNYRFKGKISSITGKEHWFKINEATREVIVPFWTATLVARDQLGSDVVGAQIRVRYYFEEWFVSGKSVTLPKEFNAQVYSNVPSVTGPRIYVKFTDGLSEVNPGFWTFTVQARDQFGVVVPNGSVRLRSVSGEYFSDGDIVTVPKNDTISVRSRRSNLEASNYTYVKFTDGMDFLQGKFQSVLFKAVATDGTTLVPDAEIELVSSQLSKFVNNSRQAVPVPDSVRVRVYKDGALIADVNTATFDEAIDTLVINTSWQASSANAAPVIDSNPTANPNPVQKGVLVTFQVGASDADNDPLSYTWNFGDGTSGSGEAPSHTYNATGDYSVNVTVEDGNGGSTSESFNITVEDSIVPQLDVITVVVKGTTSDASGIASLKVNGVTVQVAGDGTWQREVTLVGGSTNVDIVATDGEGNSSARTVVIAK